MYQQARMETQLPNIVEKLSDLPAVNETYNQVLDIYERTKGHNVLFRTSIGLAEYATRAIVGRAVPVVYNSYTKSTIGVVNDLACISLDALEEKYPIITSPRDEIIEECKTKGEGIYNMPALAPVRLGVAVAEKGLGVTKSAVDVGKTVTYHALAPARLAYQVSSTLARGTVNTVRAAAQMSLDSVKDVMEHTHQTWEELVEYLSTTENVQYFLQKCDLTLDATEKLMSEYLPEGEVDKGEEPVARAERAMAIACRLHQAILDKAQGDFVRFSLLAGICMQQIMEITGYYLTVTKDKCESVWSERQHYMDAFDRLWNRYVQFIPEQARPVDPANRATAVMKLVVERLVVLLSLILKSTLSYFDTTSEAFMQWCKGTQAFITQNFSSDLSKLINYFTLIFPYLTNIIRWIIQSSVAILDSVAEVVAIPADLGAIEMEDVGMGRNCNGMGAEVEEPLGNCVH